jgi:hypothetical protein
MTLQQQSSAARTRTRTRACVQGRHAPAAARFGGNVGAPWRVATCCAARCAAHIGDCTARSAARHSLVQLALLLLYELRAPGVGASSGGATTRKHQRGVCSGLRRQRPLNRPRRTACPPPCPPSNTPRIRPRCASAHHHTCCENWLAATAVSCRLSCCGAASRGRAGSAAARLATATAPSGGGCGDCCTSCCACMLLITRVHVRQVVVQVLKTQAGTLGRHCVEDGARKCKCRCLRREATLQRMRMGWEWRAEILVDESGVEGVARARLFFQERPHDSSQASNATCHSRLKHARQVREGARSAVPRTSNCTMRHCRTPEQLSSSITPVWMHVSRSAGSSRRSPRRATPTNNILQLLCVLSAISNTAQSPSGAGCS